MNSDHRIKEIQKSIFLVQLFSGPATIALGLGLYGVFGAKGDAFIPILNNLNVCYGLLAVGIIIEILAIPKLLPLWKELAKLKNVQTKNT